MLEGEDTTAAAFEGQAEDDVLIEAESGDETTDKVSEKTSNEEPKTKAEECTGTGISVVSSCTSIKYWFTQLLNQNFCGNLF